MYVLKIRGVLISALEYLGNLPLQVPTLPSPSGMRCKYVNTVVTDLSVSFHRPDDLFLVIQISTSMDTHREGPFSTHVSACAWLLVERKAEKGLTTDDLVVTGVEKYGKSRILLTRYVSTMVWVLTGRFDLVAYVCKETTIAAVLITP